MAKRSLLVLGLVGCMSAFVSAEVFVEYWPVGDTPNGVNEPIVTDVITGDVTMTLNIGVTAPRGDGTQEIAAGDFDFDPPPGISMTNFQWNAVVFDPALGWFPDNTLPAPALSRSGGGPVYIPVGPDPQLVIATLDVLIGASVLPGDHFIRVGSFNNRWQPTINDNRFEEYVIDDGSSSIPFHVNPEPATLALLAIGGLGLLRRRRSVSS